MNIDNIYVVEVNSRGYIVSYPDVGGGVYFFATILGMSTSEYKSYLLSGWDCYEWQNEIFFRDRSDAEIVVETIRARVVMSLLI